MNYSIEAEQEVLAVLMHDPAKLSEIQQLKTEHFYNEHNRAIFRALVGFLKAGEAVDSLKVFKAAQAESGLGDEAYIEAIAESYYTSRHVKKYAKVVQDKAIVREIIRKLDEAHEIAIGEEELPAKLDRIGGLLSGIDSGEAQNMPKHMSDVIGRVVDRLNEAADCKTPQGWSTGDSELDYLLVGGLRPGKLYVVAARPGVGKTSKTFQMAVNVSKLGHPCAVFNQEMEDIELGQRALANVARVDYSGVLAGRLKEEEWERVAEGVDHLGRSSIWIDQQGGLSLRDINMKARSIRGLKVLIVDYLQLCEGEGKTRTEAVGSISRGLKKLAKELGIAIILLSQLNREVEKRPGGKPFMSDLRDSGEIEQDADVIVLMWPMEDDPNAEYRSIGIEVAKNRGGRKGSYVQTFHGATQSWQQSTKKVEDFMQQKKWPGAL